LLSGVPLIKTRPFRSPHHTVSAAGLSGGGRIPRPGEISLSHNGVLFLDELPEFGRDALEILRQPLEDGTVTISRVAGTLTYPCSIMLVCAMNPCPCGFYGHPKRRCTCPPGAVAKYLSRISGPLLDRLDLHVEVPAVEFDELDKRQKSEPSHKIKARVNNARAIQQERYKEHGITCNARLTPALMREYCGLTDEARALLKKSFELMGLSARAYDRILKVSRTIADLDGSSNIEINHVAEAVQYRSLDRKYWDRK
jgi:magnesium chelatase family protein